MKKLLNLPVYGWTGHLKSRVHASYAGKVNRTVISNSFCWQDLFGLMPVLNPADKGIDLQRYLIEIVEN